MWFDKVVRCGGSWSDPLFVAKDVCAALEITYHDAALAGLEEHHKGTRVVVGTLGGPQEMATVTEAGLYNLILRSRKPAAKVFEKWLTTEVLPAIRRTGRYSTKAGGLALGFSMPGDRRALPPASDHATDDAADLARLLVAVLGDKPRKVVQWPVLAAEIARLELFKHLPERLALAGEAPSEERLRASQSRYLQKFRKRPIPTPEGSLVLQAHGSGVYRYYAIERVEGGAA